MPTCPNCGHLNNEVSTFCQQCGTRLISQSLDRPFPRSPISYQAPSRVGGGNPIITIILVVLITVSVISAVSIGVFYFTTARQISRVSGFGPVHITSLAIAIVYANASDKYFGQEFQFPVVGSIDLQHGQTYQVATKLMLSSGASHSIDSATLGYSDGFIIQSETPNLPFIVTPGSSFTLTITLQAPTKDYSGSVTIDLFTH